MAHTNLVTHSRSNHKMSSPNKEGSVKNTYQYVINDTVASLNEIFIEEGIDLQVLENLKELWESKLKTSKVCEEKVQPSTKDNKVATAVQIVIPSNTKPPAKLVVNVPSSVVANNQLSKMFSGSVLQSVLDLPVTTAQAVIQDHINKFIEMNKEGNISQVDGSSSSDEDDISSKDDSDETMEFIVSEEVLNSDDDLTEEDDGNDFEGDDNLIVCQYEKVMKTKGHWKFIFKDGVMNLNGKESVFKRACGEAMW